MLLFRSTNRFEKDLVKAVKSGKDSEKIRKVMKDIAGENALDPQLKDHKLIGDYVDHRECHIEPDWLLIYQVDKKANAVLFVRTGTHSELY